MEPGPVASVVVEPAEVTLDIGDMRQFTFEAFDEFDNEIADSLSSWRVSSDIGEIEVNGLFTTETKAGKFDSAIQIEVVEGTRRASAKVDVDILPNPLDMMNSPRVPPGPGNMRTIAPT